MTADIELLPLPRTLQHADDADLAAHVQDYARANVAHATAAMVAEIEALVHDLEQTRANVMAEHEARIEAEVRAERLAEAIKAYKSECDNPAKDYVLRAKRRDEMFALLRDHDQEGKG